MCNLARWLGAAFVLVALLGGCAHRGIRARARGTASVSAYDGGAIYRQQCATCHGVGGEGVAGVAPGLRLGRTLDSRAALRAVAWGSRHGEAVMPGWCGLLSAREIADVVAYVRVTWGGRRHLPTRNEIATLCRPSAHRAAR